MPSTQQRRWLSWLVPSAAWGYPALLVLLCGCVDAPEPVVSEAPAVQIEPSASDLEPTEPTPAVESDSRSGQTGIVAALEPTPESASPDAEPTLAVQPTSATMPSALPLSPEPTLAGPTPIEEEPTPVAEASGTSLIPGGLSSATAAPLPEPAAPSPFPTASEPTPASAEPTVAASEPTLAEASASPSTSENPKPLEVVKSKSLILISPRSAASIADAKSKGETTEQVSSNQPAIILPPSAAADAAKLAPVIVSTSPENPEAAPEEASEKGTALASLDLKMQLPPPAPLPESPDDPSDKVSGIPASTVSISQSHTAPPEGFVTLFNQKDLTGWEVFDGKSESWRCKDGEVSCVAPGGGWLQSQTLYCDFELRFEYRLSAGGNSGVSLRFPGHGNPSLEGLEIQLLDDRAEKYQSIQPQQATGSLYFVTPPQIKDAAHPAGEWNQCALRCVGNKVEVVINEQLVNEIDLGALISSESGKPKRSTANHCPMGTIALQSHSTRVDFRNVHIRDLTQALESGVRWLDLQVGTGDPVPSGAKITVHYVGYLSTGKRFANSFEKGKPATVPLKDVIPGWREGIPGMKVGGKRRLIVPAEMAYGTKGFKEIVPPNSTLVYEIELTGFENLAADPVTAEVETSANASAGTSELK